MILRHAILLTAGLAAFVATAGDWKHLDDASWYSGPKLTEADLAGKVVLVDCWGVHCPPCRALLPRMEALWNAYKTKPFVLIGSHCQGRDEAAVNELVQKNKLTYSIYERAGIVNEPEFRAIPFLYVINHRGKLVYSGNDERAATEAFVTALSSIGLPPTLAPGVAFRKYKALEKKLVLGKNIKSDVKKLEKDVKQLAKAKSPAQLQQRAEAEAILAALKEGLADIKDELEAQMKINPTEALKLYKLFKTTFPKEAEAYAERIPELESRSVEQKSAAKTK